MLWGATLRCPHPRARIRAIDIGAGARRAAACTPCSPTRTSRAARPTGSSIHDQPVLAFDEVRYQGEPVAIVAADHPETARRAADRIEVDYEVLEPLDRPRVRALDPTRRRCTRRATCCATCTSRTATGAGRGRRRGHRRVRGRHAGPGVPRPGVRARGAGRGRRRRPLHRDPVAARRPRPGRRLASTCRPTRCGSRSPASAARSAGARTSRCRSTPACSRCTPAGR